MEGNRLFSLFIAPTQQITTPAATHYRKLSSVAASTRISRPRTQVSRETLKLHWKQSIKRFLVIVMSSALRSSSMPALILRGSRRFAHTWFMENFLRRAPSFSVHAADAANQQKAFPP